MGQTLTRRPSTFAFVVACSLAVVVLAVAELLGPVPGRATTADMGRALAAGIGLDNDVPSAFVAIVYDVRLPRVLVAAFAGASLALAGTVMQAVFRNPLASPDVMGTQAGSALGAVVAIGLGFASSNVLAAPAFAFLGAGAVSFVVFLAASVGGRSSVTGILLAGLAMNSLVGALTAFVVSLVYRDYTRNGEVLQWLMGGLEKSTLDHAMVVGGGLLLFGLAALPFARDMDLLTLSPHSAESLGVDVARARKVLLTIACGVTATAVSSTGGIVFIGLVVPHMVRLVVGPTHRRLLPCATVAGALMLLLADAVCQFAGSEVDLRLGVVTALLGAPFFLLLLARYREAGHV